MPKFDKKRVMGLRYGEDKFVPANSRTARRATLKQGAKPVIADGASFENWFLQCKTGHKLWLLARAVHEGKLGTAMSLGKLLLDAPISKGGISSEIVEQVLTNGNHPLIDKWLVETSAIQTKGDAEAK
jgi:hypothetical protein